jgi:hypothetical protein
VGTHLGHSQRLRSGHWAGQVRRQPPCMQWSSEQFMLLRERLQVSLGMPVEVVAWQQGDPPGVFRELIDRLSSTEDTVAPASDDHDRPDNRVDRCHDTGPEGHEIRVSPMLAASADTLPSLPGATG